MSLLSVLSTFYICCQKEFPEVLLEWSLSADWNESRFLRDLTTLLRPRAMSVFDTQ